MLLLMRKKIYSFSLLPVLYTHSVHFSTSFIQTLSSVNSGIKSDKLRNLVKYCDIQEDASRRKECEVMTEMIHNNLPVFDDKGYI